MSFSAWPTLTFLRLRNAGVALVMGLAAAALFAPSAFALAPGVTLDPGSPAGQQYAYPLSVLRGQGAGHQAPAAGSTAPLFGVGVTPATRKTPAAHGDRHRAGPAAGAGAGAGVGHRVHRANASATAKSRRRTRKVTRLSSPGVASLETTQPSRVPIGIALVLVLGVGLGIGLRALVRRG